MCQLSLLLHVQHNFSRAPILPPDSSKDAEWSEDKEKLRIKKKQTQQIDQLSFFYMRSITFPEP